MCSVYTLCDSRGGWARTCFTLEILGWSEVPVQWSVSFQVLNSSGRLGGFISSPWATAATRVIRQPKSTLGVARQLSGGGRQAGKASWPLVYGLLANQLALVFSSFFGARRSKCRGRKLPRPRASHFHVPVQQEWQRVWLCRDDYSWLPRPDFTPLF